MAVQYGQPPPDVKGRRVYIFDFSYPRIVMERLMREAVQLQCFDHHKTAEAELYGLPGCNFDMERSGGRLAWEYFFPGDTAPWLVNYTEDRDLWKHELPNSEEINAGLRSFPLNFTTWDELSSGPGQLIGDGIAILRRERQIIDEHIKHAHKVTIAGHQVLAVNATVLFSNIAGELAKGRPFGVAWFERADGKRQFSLRSDENGVDVSEVAVKFGGGGHKHAAGYEQ